MRLKLLACSGAALLFMAAQSIAQTQPTQPAPPPTVPPPPEYAAPLSNAQAKAALNAALEEGKKNNWRLAVTIVGPTGDLIMFEKMDGAQNASVMISQKKARSAALYRRSTKVFQELLAAGNAFYLTFPEVIASEGGLPIVVDGKVVGAIGVSGGTGQQDGSAAKAGADAVK